MNIQAQSANDIRTPTKLSADNKAEPDLIGTEGTMKYFQDIGVDLEGVDVLIASELLKCEILGELKRQNFIDGWASTNADTISKQKSLLAARKSSLTAPTSRPLFHAIYKHTFTIARASTSQKVVPLDAALINWRTLFSSPSIDWRTPSTPWLDYWCEFLEARWKKSVNRDMWEQTYQFFEQTVQDESMDWYSEEGAWPSVIDEFVAFVREEKRGGEGHAGEMDVG
ncbi:MAG: hypothetical protein Q9165_007101 [Trypethelium subeluteriae]